MAQSKIDSFFVSRKRAAPDDFNVSKNKQLALGPRTAFNIDQTLLAKKIVTTLENEMPCSKTVPPQHTECNNIPKPKNSAVVKLTFDNLGQRQCVSSIIPKNPSQLNCVNSGCPPSKEGTAEDSGIQIPDKGNSVNKTLTTPKANCFNVKYTADSKIDRKELNLGDIKKKLLNSQKLSQLKASAEKFSTGYQKLKDLEGPKSLKEFKVINVEVPKSPKKKSQADNVPLTPKKSVQEQKLLMSPRKVIVSPVKSPSKVPAYIRHASLATSSTSLPLPHHYRQLGEIFRAMETVVSIRFNRNEKITFTKLKLSVQEMLKKNFVQNHLKQIKFLVPDFYKYDIEKTKTFGGALQKDTFDLTITPMLPADVKVLNSAIILERRRTFYEKLLQHVKEHHKTFLQTLDPPMSILNDKIVRWHPEFDLEKVPEVKMESLPEMPNVEKFSTAQDVLSKARDIFKCNTKMGRALEKLAEMKARGMSEKEKDLLGLGSSDSVQTPNETPSTSNVTILNPALRNLPKALLEKVKAKQAAKALEAMTRTSEQEKKYFVYSRLPDLARTLRNIFVTERKNILALNVILSKLDSSFKARVSANDLNDDIKTLSEIFPNWLKLTEIRNTVYVKLDKGANLEQIKAKLESMAQNYKVV